MLIAGIIIASLGTIGIFTAVGLEIRYKEPKFKLLMKIMPWLIGIGMFLIGLSYT